jgi:hypothetical protein
MRRNLVLLSILALGSFAAQGALAAPALDSAGKCRDNGKFVEAKLCEAAATAAKCRDVKTKKFAKCGTPGTEPVPVASKPAAAATPTPAASAPAKPAAPAAAKPAAAPAKPATPAK